MFVGRTSVLLAVLSPLAPPVTAQEPPATADAPGWVETKPIPRRFPRITDAAGCRWGLEQDGAVALSGSAAQPALSLFRHAARLTVNGQPFAPQSAQTTADASRVRLSGVAGPVAVTRDIWIDRERGAVRYCDTVANPSDEPAAITLVHQTVFDQPVPALHRTDGAALPDDANRTREGAIAFLQTQPEGMSSAVFLVGDPKGRALPSWTGKKNSEAQAFEWKLDVPANASASVVAWVAQRPTLAPDEIKAVAESFFKNGRLLQPKLDGPAIASLVNFPARGLTADEGGESAATADDVLAALTRLVGKLGIERSESDVYYMNPKSVLEGEATGEPLALESRFGAVTVPLAEVAAVQGGGGRGRWPRIFLRDGHVLSGPVTLPGWKISGTKGWAISLNADSLEALVLRTSPDDGAGQTAPHFLAQLTSGDTLPLRLEAEARLLFVTPWGPLDAPVAEITGLWRTRQPTPAARLTLRDGSDLTVLPTPQEIKGTSSRLGPVTLQATDLAALWPPGIEAPESDRSAEEIASLDDLEEAAAPRALLRGSSVIVATLADESITLLSGGTETALKTTELGTLARAEGASDALPVFTVTLASGASFEGTLQGGSVALKVRGGTVWSVPQSHFLGWKQAQTPDSR